MVYPIYGMYDDAKRASDSHYDDCEECQRRELVGDMCDEGRRLLTRATCLYESIQEGPPDMDDDR